MPEAFQSLLAVARVSVERLGKYLEPLQISEDRIVLARMGSLSVELRIAELGLVGTSKKYYIVFVFDRHKKNRLILLTPSIITEVTECLTKESLDVLPSASLILVGKEGSRQANFMLCIFHCSHIGKLSVLDFTGLIPLADFLSSILMDIDKVETRLRSLRNHTRTDLTSLPTSEKKVRLTSDASTHDRMRVLFANQLLQLPGVNEKIATTLASMYGLPIRLMNELAINGNDIRTFTLTSNMGDSKRINSMVLNGIVKTFHFSSSPEDPVR